MNYSELIPKLRPLKKLTVNEVFDLLDDDKSGTLTRDEVVSVRKDTKEIAPSHWLRTFSRVCILAHFLKMKADNEGTLFLSVLSILRWCDIFFCFYVLISFQLPVISLPDLCTYCMPIQISHPSPPKVANHLRLEITEAEASSMFDELDVDKSGTLSKQVGSAHVHVNVGKNASCFEGKEIREGNKNVVDPSTQLDCYSSALCCSFTRYSSLNLWGSHIRN